MHIKNEFRSDYEGLKDEDYEWPERLSDKTDLLNNEVIADVTVCPKFDWR